MQQKQIVQLLRDTADGLCNKPHRVSIALTACGSELPIEALLSAARDASDTLQPVIIGPQAAEGLPHVYAEDLNQAHQIMEQMLAKGEIAGAVTLHYNFPLGTTTITALRSVATGRQMVLSSTTGSSDIHRTAALVKNSIYGIALAKALNIDNPTLGLLNIEGVSTVERVLKKLADKGFPLNWAGSSRSDGGALMRGNDLIQATPDVMVCDSLTGNLLVKIWSAGQSGGQTETVGVGYGIGLGPAQQSPIAIISRASGPSVISEALRFCAMTANNKVMHHCQKIWQQAQACGVNDLLKQSTDATPAAAKDSNAVPMPEKTVVNEEINGIDILQIEDAKFILWQNKIYAESGMGCTGPVLMVNHKQRELALSKLTEFLG